jgi:hypothetical protein
MKHTKCFDKECLQCVQKLIDKATTNAVYSDTNGNVIITGNLQVNGNIYYETVNVNNINANSIDINNIAVRGDVGDNNYVLTSNGESSSWQPVSRTLEDVLEAGNKASKNIDMSGNIIQNVTLDYLKLDDETHNIIDFTGKTLVVTNNLVPIIIGTQTYYMQLYRLQN